MNDDLPLINYDVSVSGAPYVTIDDAQVTTPTDLIAAAPFLDGEDHLYTHAFLLNHMAEGYSHALIDDVAAFQAEYMERYNAEDPDEERGPGTVRLHNFGIPDFASMHQPMKIGDELVFFVENKFLGVPYKVTMGPSRKLNYAPVAMAE
ncbi:MULTISPECIES: hypothetical protein [unclassified Tateyamaria]|jgi:hypothetical protein|uniref:hypothetical protein n=2 Tax=Tateyamaria TaxID=299261 RepID=UPI000D5597F2|nr:hypothetical protein [Tateyamaria sp. Alg231-49]